MFGVRLKEFREARKMTQPQLAAVFGVSKQSVSNWENGNVLPTIDMLINLANYFGTSTDYLLGLDDRHYLEISDLSNEELAHIQLLMQDLKNRGS